MCQLGSWEALALNYFSLFHRRILRILILHFRQFPSAPRTLDFNKITKPQKHYKTCLKCKIPTRLGLRKRQNNKFHPVPVAFFGFQDSWPNGSAASLPILPHFLDEKRRMRVFLRKYVCSATGRPEYLSAASSSAASFSASSSSPQIAADTCAQLRCAYFKLPRRNGRSPRIRRGYSPKHPKERESPYGV